MTRQESGTHRRLQAISPVDARVVWASGVGGTYALTTDGGATWRSRVVPGAEALEFRDVHGVSERVAYLLAAGDGSRSRIYLTTDGGDSWALLFQNRDLARFCDCFAFWSPTRGVVMADSVGGRFPLIATTDGRSWSEIGDRLPSALPGESAFAASGTCVATHGSRRAWIVTGGAERARVLATADGGATWTAHDAPIERRGEGAGGFSIAFRDPLHGIVAGGSLAAATERSSTFARSSDGGATWRPATRPPFPGAIYGVAYAIDRGRDAVATRAPVVATGPGGSSWSPDEGDTWFPLPAAAGYWAVGFADPVHGWLVGDDGRILAIELGPAPR
ncbi:MAG TPA: hypothetical protein VK698_20970 [Kofleriaceae bacterium]|nr:hypothetical protein [Kofleriaceae bacterium]